MITSGTDLLCSYCGRPVVNSSCVWGNAGPYHIECVHGPTLTRQYVSQQLSGVDFKQLIIGYIDEEISKNRDYKILNILLSLKEKINKSI